MFEWEYSPLKALSDCEIVLGQSPPSKSYNDKKKGKPFVQGKAEFGYKYVSPIKYTTEPIKEAQEGDILISVRAPVGDVNIAPYNLSIGRGLAAIRFKKTSNTFYYYWFQYNKNFIESLGMGSTFKAITGEQLKKLKVPIVNLSEQKAIAQILSTVDEAIQKADEAIKLAERLKQGLMQKLLTEGINNTEFKDTKIGRIPKEWEVIPLQEIFELASGKSRPKDTTDSHSESHSIPIYGGNGILGFTQKTLVENDVIVIGRVGEYCGSVHLAPNKSWITDNALYTKSFKIPERVDIYFLYLSLVLLHLNKFKRISGQPLMTQGIVYSKSIFLPAIQEQKRIVEIIKNIEKKLSLEKNRKQKFERIKKGLMNDLLTGKKRVKI